MIEVKGNGNVISREFAVSSFIRLHLAGSGMVVLQQGEEEKVIVETDENLLEYFEIVNAGRTLYVTAEGKLRKPVFTSCKITVFLRQLNVLYNRSEKGELQCANTITLTEPLEVKLQCAGSSDLSLDAPSVKVLNQGMGPVIMKGRCNLLEIKNQGTGDITANEFAADELQLKNMGTGNVSVRAAKSITISNFGTGFIHYYGDAVLKDVKQYGTGQIKHMTA